MASQRKGDGKQKTRETALVVPFSLRWNWRIAAEVTGQFIIPSPFPPQPLLNRSLDDFTGVVGQMLNLFEHIGIETNGNLGLFGMLGFGGLFFHRRSGTESSFILTNDVNALCQSFL